MRKISIITEIKNGKLIRNQNLIKKAIESFEGKIIVMELKVNRNKRSNNQNRYYWAVIVPIWQNIIETEWGEYYGKNEMNEFLKYNCNFVEKATDSGEVLRTVKSSTTNDTQEQERFHDATRKLAMDMFNTDIPLPNEQITIN